jgi:hypothetical protein
MNGIPPAPRWASATAPIPRRRAHRITFAAAGVYNLAWGAFTMAYPQWLFDLAHMEGANHPEVFATLGMVIGLYGVLYLSVAADTEQGWLIAAVGMTGKTLGPAGLALLLIRGTWPPATIVICLTNDLIWWLPFARYLRDARPQLRRARAPGGWNAGPGRVLRQSGSATERGGAGVGFRCD